MSQLNEDKTALNKNWRCEVLMIIFGRFTALVNDDKKYATGLMYRPLLCSFPYYRPRYNNEIMKSKSELYCILLCLLF